VVAEIFVDFNVLDVWNILVAGFLGVGIFQRHDFGCRCVLGLLFDVFVILVIHLAGGYGRRLAGQHLLEIGARIAFAGIGGNDRIHVEIVELLARIGVDPLGAAFGTGHRCSSWWSLGARGPIRSVRLWTKPITVKPK